MQLHKCPKEFCPPLSDFHVYTLHVKKNAQLVCFKGLCAFGTRVYEHLRLK